MLFYTKPLTIRSVVISNVNLDIFTCVLNFKNEKLNNDLKPEFGICSIGSEKEISYTGSYYLQFSKDVINIPF